MCAFRCSGHKKKTLPNHVDLCCPSKLSRSNHVDLYVFKSRRFVFSRAIFSKNRSVKLRRSVLVQKSRRFIPYIFSKKQYDTCIAFRSSHVCTRQITSICSCSNHPSLIEHSRPFVLHQITSLVLHLITNEYACELYSIISRRLR